MKRVFGRREGELHRELMKKMFGDRWGNLLDQRLLKEDETGNLFGQDLGGKVSDGEGPRGPGRGSEEGQERNRRSVKAKECRPEGTSDEERDLRGREQSGYHQGGRSRRSCVSRSSEDSDEGFVRVPVTRGSWRSEGGGTPGGPPAGRERFGGATCRSRTGSSSEKRPIEVMGLRRDGGEEREEDQREETRVTWADGVKAFRSSTRLGGLEASGKGTSSAGALRRSADLRTYSGRGGSEGEWELGRRRNIKRNETFYWSARDLRDRGKRSGAPSSRKTTLPSKGLFVNSAGARLSRTGGRNQALGISP